MKKIIVISLAVGIFLLSSCANHRAVQECMDRHPGCRWNCELQYGWKLPGSRSDEEARRNAAVERCYW